MEKEFFRFFLGEVQFVFPYVPLVEVAVVLHFRVVGEDGIKSGVTAKYPLEGEDKTGRNRAYDDFQNIEKNILVAYDNLDNPNDIQMFEEYLLKNLALYFDKFEGELATTPEEPQAAQNAQPDEPAIAPEEEGEPETDIPDFELEEGMEINLESLIDKLLEQ